MKNFNKQILEAVKRGLYRGLNLSINDFDDDLENDDLSTIYLDGYIKKLIKAKGVLDMLFDDISILADNLLFSESTLKYVNLLKNYNKKYAVKTKNLLDEIIEAICEVYPNADLNWLDVSNITNMNYMFYNSKFNGDISNWDVSSVIDMSFMFYKSLFKGDISNWDVRSAEDMDYMFYGSKFNNDISNWGVSSVKDMSFMFTNSDFNQDISNWNISKNCNNIGMFYNCPIKEEYKPK